MTVNVAKPGEVDKARIEAAVRAILEAVGEDPGREGLRETPRRIAEMYAELLSGVGIDPAAVLEVGFEENHHEMIVVKDIPFYSLCEHHLLPFHGVAHVGYIPEGRVVGISKIARVVEALARRPQVQERLTSQVVDLLCEGGLRARGAGVVVEAEHLCMTMRGVRKPGSRVVTSATRGIFRDDARTRAEFFAIVEGRR
jgi:GTP cyclohydrolase I